MAGDGAISEVPGKSSEEPKVVSGKDSSELGQLQVNGRGELSEVGFGGTFSLPRFPSSIRTEEAW